MASLLLAFAGCAHARNSEWVADEVARRTGYAPDVERKAGDAPRVPTGVSIADGVSEEEAVAIALWNHPRFRVDLARLATARANLADARRPSNPTLRFLFPAGPQQLAALLTWPLENLVAMRRRIDIASTDLDAAAESVVQTALDVTRDARIAHVEWVLADDRLRVRRQLAAQADAIAVIAEARGKAGDVALRERDAARADALVAADDAARAEHDVAIAERRLRVLLGDGEHPLRPSAVDVVLDDPTARDDLPQLAIASRPDLRAAQLAIESAGARIGLEKLAVLRLAGVANVQGASITGGVQAELPIANQNQGGIGRARAELEAASWRYQDLRLRIVGEVEDARLRLRRALGSLATYRQTIVAARQGDIAVVTAAYELGEQDYAGVLIASQRLEEARLREVELVAEVRRARAELERALGRRLATAPKEGRP
ncbi:MAG TPA: TolC family protein [Nannocystaceae bacterium]|nr:TolC family protein [Nannocystaceae bacterium]